MKDQLERIATFLLSDPSAAEVLLDILERRAKTLSPAQLHKVTPTLRVTITDLVNETLARVTR